MLVFEPQNLTEDFAWIYRGDPAIDRAADKAKERFDRAVELGDPSLLPLVEGQEPTVFWLRHPRGELRRKLRAECPSLPEPDQARLIVRRCLMRADNAGDLAIEPGNVSDESLDLLESINEGHMLQLMALAVLERMTPDPLSWPDSDSSPGSSESEAR